MADPQERSTPALMADLLDQVTQLVRKEVQLFRAEMSDKATQAMVAAGSILAAAVIAITALNVLAAALVTALTTAGIPAPWSAVIVGVGLAVVAFVMAKKGIDNLKAGSLAPEQVKAFDDELAGMLARDFPREPLQVTHCLHAAFGRKGD